MPGILGIETEALHILRKTPVVRGGEDASRSIVDRKLRGIRQVIGRVLWKRNQFFRSAGERSAEHRFVNEIYAESRGMPAHDMRDVVTHLVLLLVAEHRKIRNAGYELVVAISFKTGDDTRSCGERKRKRKAKIRIARLRQMEPAELQDERSNPLRRKCELLADHRIEIVVVRSYTGRRQRA